MYGFGYSVLLRFRHLFMWLKFTTVTPSFYFRNRLFIEKGFRSNNMYTFPGNTQKSFTWLRGSSSNLSIYWFRRRGLKWFVFVLLLLLSLFMYFDFSHFTSVYSTQLVRFLFYTFWRSYDGLFFLATQFYIFGLAFIFKLWGFFVRIVVVHSLPSTTTPKVGVSAPSYLSQNELVTYTHVDGVLNNSLTNLFEEFHKTDVVEHNVLTSAARKLYLLLFSLRTDTLPSFCSSDPCKRLVPEFCDINKPFTLEYLVPRGMYLVRRTTPSVNTNNLSSIFSGNFTQLSTGSVFLKNASTVNTLRWITKYAPASSKDLNYLRNLPISFNYSLPSLNNQLPGLDLFKVNTLLIPNKALEWSTYRINWLTQSTSIITLPQQPAMPSSPSSNNSKIDTLRHLLMCYNPRKGYSWYQASLVFETQSKFYTFYTPNNPKVLHRLTSLTPTKLNIYTNRRWF